MAKTADKIDFLAACKATDSRNKALEEIRDKGSDVILAIFRLLKNSLVHALGNKAVQTTVKETHSIISDFASIVGGYVSITFVDDTIFVCGQLLRASRTIYESAMEVGKLLGACGVSEVSFTGELTEADLLAFCEAFATSVRDPEKREKLLEAKLNNVTRAPGRLHAAEERGRREPARHGEDAARVRLGAGRAASVLRAHGAGQDRAAAPRQARRAAHGQHGRDRRERAARDEHARQRAPRGGRTRGADRDPVDHRRAPADDEPQLARRSWRWRR